MGQCDSHLLLRQKKRRLIGGEGGSINVLHSHRVRQQTELRPVVESFSAPSLVGYHRERPRFNFSKEKKPRFSPQFPRISLFPLLDPQRIMSSRFARFAELVKTQVGPGPGHLRFSALLWLVYAHVYYFSVSAHPPDGEDDPIPPESPSRGQYLPVVVMAWFLSFLELSQAIKAPYWSQNIATKFALLSTVLHVATLIFAISTFPSGYWSYRGWGLIVGNWPLVMLRLWWLSEVFTWPLTEDPPGGTRTILGAGIIVSIGVAWAYFAGEARLSLFPDGVTLVLIYIEMGIIAWAGPPGRIQGTAEAKKAEAACTSGMSVLGCVGSWFSYAHYFDDVFCSFMTSVGIFWYSSFWAFIFLAVSATIHAIRAWISYKYFSDETESLV